MIKHVETSELYKLFVQYIDMFDIIVLNIQSSRIGDWPSYVSSLQQMLPYLVAARRRNYVKSIIWFLDEIECFDNVNINADPQKSNS